jgi:3-oxoacyl-[acyl-carrier protein] reductase
MSNLIGKTALVTGASRGIGKAIALKLAALGAHVAVNYARSRAEAEDVARECNGFAVEADLADLTAIEAMFNRVHREFEKLDILINNAGVGYARPIAETPIEDFDRIFAVNARGAFFCLQEAAKALPDGGRIVNISTGATVTSPQGFGIYCGSKAALEQFTRILARELAPRQITVNTVSPGFTETDMYYSLPHLADLAPRLTPLGRAGKPEEIADVVAWLCTPEASWITGQNIQASGGLNMV